MGIGNSRERFGQRPRQGLILPRFNGGRRNYQRGCFRRRKPSLTTQTILPTVTQSLFHQTSYGSYHRARPVPVYPQLQPISSPYLPISYNIPPQYMMMPPPPRIAPVVPTPYMSPLPPPPMPMPYVQSPQIQPAYNNIGIPPSMPGGAGYYSSPYLPAPARLLTDWTGGGQISPGFLGPPL